MDEPIAIIPKNSLEEIRIDLSEFKGNNLVSARVYYDAGNDDWRPTKKGLTIKVSLLPDLLKGLQKAIEQAQKSGWL